MDKGWKLDSLELKVIQWYLTDSIDAQEKVRNILRKLIQLYGTHAKTAKALNLIRQTLTYRLNHAKMIHLEDALKMIALLRSNKSEIEIRNDVIKQLVFSEQVQMAWEDLEKSRKPRGRKSGKKMEENKAHLTKFSENFVKLTIKTVRLEEEIAIQYGFDNRETLRQAIKIWQSVKISKTASPLLIQVLDDKEIKIHKAYRFLSHPLEMQEQLVQRDQLKRKHRRQRNDVQSKQNDHMNKERSHHAQLSPY